MFSVYDNQTALDGPPGGPAAPLGGSSAAGAAGAESDGEGGAVETEVVDTALCLDHLFVGFRDGSVKAFDSDGRLRHRFQPHRAKVLRCR